MKDAAVEAPSRSSSRARPDTAGPSGGVITFAGTRTSPQPETSQITITPQITAAAVILIFLGNFNARVFI